MGILLTERHWLLQVLSRLSGDDDGKGRESNEHIREALAEAILYLVQPLRWMSSKCTLSLAMMNVYAVMWFTIANNAQVQAQW